MAKTEWLGRDTFPRLWIWVCIAFNWVGILALLLLAIAEVVLISNDYRNYVHVMGYKYRGSAVSSARHYPSDTAGFVDYTNAPEHLGSAIWMLFYQISIVLLVLLAAASDFGWRNATTNDYGTRYVQMFHAEGIMRGTRNAPFFYYVVANGFLKLYIVVLYMSQSFYGMSGGSHAPPWTQDSINSTGSGSGSDSGHITVSVGSSTSTTLGTTTLGGDSPFTTVQPQGGPTSGIWSGAGTYTGAVDAASKGTVPTARPTATRAGGATASVAPLTAHQLDTRSSSGSTFGPDNEAPPDALADFLALQQAQAAADRVVFVRARVRRALDPPSDPERIYGVEAWAYWMGWIVLGSIVPSVIAFIFLGTRERVEKEKKDAEAAAEAAAKEKEAKKAAAKKESEARAAKENKDSKDPKAPKAPKDGKDSKG